MSRQDDVIRQLDFIAKLETLLEEAWLARRKPQVKLYRRQLRRARRVLRILAGAETRMDRIARYLGEVLGGVIR